MDFREKIDLQLLRISRGAHELTEMIDSWFKSSNFDGQQNFIVNDPLRGAMELQDSLYMHSRLQEPSRRMSMMQMRQREREEDAEDDCLDVIRYKGLQEHRLSADCSLMNCMQDMKQVIRDRFHKFDNEKVSSTKNLMLSKSKVDFPAQAKRMKAPNLVAKLMGLEDLPSDDQINEEQDEEKVLKTRKSHVINHQKLGEIIETMRSSGVLKSEQSVSLGIKSDEKYGTNLNQKSMVLPIVIMKPQHLHYREREEVNQIPETSVTVCELVENLEQSAVMSIEEKVEPPQKLKTDAAVSQKLLKRAVVFKERSKDPKKMEINGKKQVEKKEVKAIGAPVSMNFTAPIKIDKRQAISRCTSQTNKSNVQNRKDNFSMKSASFNSNRSVKEEKLSVAKPIRKSNKPDDQKFKDGKLISTLTESQAISRSKSISGADSLLMQAKKEPTKPFEKDGIRKDYKVICEVMPRNYQTGRNIGIIEESIRKSYYKPPTKIAAEIKFLLKPLLLSSPSFSNQLHDLFDTNIIKPAFYQTRFSEEHEIDNNQLLLDSSKELMARKSCKGRHSIHQMIRKRADNQSEYISFNHLVEEISEGIKKLECYSEFDDDGSYKDSLDYILKKDLHCNESMLNAIWNDGWDDWICVEEADKAVDEVAERIFFGLLLEVAKDLI